MNKKKRYRRPQESDSDDEVAKLKPKTEAEEAAIRIDRLFRKNADKIIELPEPRKKRELSPPPEFIRAFHGSSGMAASGAAEYYHYLHVRKKDKLRVRLMEQEAKEEEEKKEYEKRIQERRQKELEKLEKKRLKRLKKKKKKKNGNQSEKTESTSSSSTESDNEDKQEEIKSGQTRKKLIKAPMNFEDEPETGDGEVEREVKPVALQNNIVVIEEDDF